VWVIYPDTQHLHVHRQDGTVSTLRAADVLSGAEVIPGFQCRVAEIFAGLGESVSGLQRLLSALQPLREVRVERAVQITSIL